MLKYVEALGKVMPPSCKLAFYDYGSPGILGYYFAQLDDLNQYPDLRTDVFQEFRETGNFIIFCLLIEQNLVGFPDEKLYTDKKKLFFSLFRP